MFWAKLVSGRHPNRPETEEIRPSPAIAPAVSRSVGRRTHLRQRGRVSQHLHGGDHVQQAQRDDRTRVELGLERHDSRHGYDLQVRETGEIDLAHRHRRHIADHQAEQHRKLLGRALHQQLERQTGDQRDQAQRQVLPAAEILGPGAAAEAFGAHGQQREADRRDHDGRDDRRHEPAPVAGRQTQDQLQQAADQHRTDHGAVSLVRADRHGGGHIGERDAGHHRQARTDQPRAVQLQAGAQARHQQTGLNHRGRLFRGHPGGGGDDEDRRQVGHEHGHDVLQTERDAAPERDGRIQTAQGLERDARSLGLLLTHETSISSACERSRNGQRNSMSPVCGSIDSTIASESTS